MTGYLVQYVPLASCVSAENITGHFSAIRTINKSMVFCFTCFYYNYCIFTSDISVVCNIRNRIIYKISYFLSVLWVMGDFQNLQFKCRISTNIITKN